MLERDNADLRKQFDSVKSELESRTQKLDAAEKESLRLRSELDTALKQIADLSKKYTDEIKRLDDSLAATRDAEHEARIEIEALKKAAPVQVVTQAQTAGMVRTMLR